MLSLSKKLFSAQRMVAAKPFTSVVPTLGQDVYEENYKKYQRMSKLIFIPLT
jgi:hypothetical protein